MGCSDAPIVVFDTRKIFTDLRLDNGISLELECNEEDNPRGSTASTLRYSLSLVTQLKRVFLLPPNLQKSRMPRLLVAPDSAAELIDWPTWDSTEGNEDIARSSSAEVSFAGPFSYNWTPDIPLGGTITQAWFACLAKDRYLGAGTAGLIVVPADSARTQWTKVGYVKYDVIDPLFHPEIYHTMVDQNNEILDEETAKLIAPNPFLVDPKETYVTIVAI